jgi:hypothetical protein
MRTKTLILSAALLAVGAASSMAQVYSVNSVGWVKRTIPTGFSLIANPLQNDDQTVPTILADTDNGGTVPLGTVIYVFSSGSYVQNVNDEFGDGWSVPSQTLDVGAGFFIQNFAAPFDQVFTGEVTQGIGLTVNLDPGYTMVSSKVPQSGALQGVLGLTPGPGDQVLRFDNVTGYTQYNFDEFDEVWNPNDPVLDVAEAIFYNNLSGGASWVRDFDVNNP